MAGGTTQVIGAEPSMAAMHGGDTVNVEGRPRIPADSQTHASAQHRADCRDNTAQTGGLKNENENERWAPALVVEPHHGTNSM